MTMEISTIRDAVSQATLCAAFQITARANAGRPALKLADSDQVVTWDELSSRVGSDPSQLEAPPSDPRAGSWARMRRAAREASIVGPAVVIALLPPYYPQSPPRPGGLGERLRPWLERQGLGFERYYP